MQVAEAPATREELGAALAAAAEAGTPVRFRGGRHEARLGAPRTAGGARAVDRRPRTRSSSTTRAT